MLGGECRAVHLFIHAYLYFNSIHTYSNRHEANRTRHLRTKLDDDTRRLAYYIVLVN